MTIFTPEDGAVLMQSDKKLPGPFVPEFDGWAYYRTVYRRELYRETGTQSYIQDILRRTACS